MKLFFNACFLDFLEITNFFENLSLLPVALFLSLMFLCLGFTNNTEVRESSNDINPVPPLMDPAVTRPSGG